MLIKKNSFRFIWLFQLFLLPLHQLIKTITIMNNNILDNNENVKVIDDMFSQLNLPSRYCIFCFMMPNKRLTFQIYDYLGDATSLLPKRIPNTDIYEGAYLYMEMFNLLKKEINKI